MYYIIFLFLAVFSFSTQLENDPSVVHGKLDCGLTYYIHKNPKTLKECDIKMVVKVGSLNEKEDERGLAHFLEHMVFRGTTNYCDGWDKNFKKVMGKTYYGNAFTSFDTTEYEYSFYDPKNETYDKLFSYIFEMMFEAKLDSQLLDKERGVVLSEKDRYASSYNPYREKLYAFFNLKTIAGRSPIGIESVIQSITSEKMKSFYKREYRPEKMALIVSSSEEPSVLLEKIKMVFDQSSSQKATSWYDFFFQKSPAQKDAVQEEGFFNESDEVENLDQPKALLYYDKHLASDSVEVFRVQKLDKVNKFNTQAIKTKLINELAIKHFKSVLSQRYMASKKYFRVSCDEQELCDFNLQSIGFSCNKDQHVQAIEAFFDDAAATLNTKLDPILFNADVNRKIEMLKRQKQSDAGFTNSAWIELFRNDFIYSHGFANLATSHRDEQLEVLSSISINEVQEYLANFIHSLKEYKHIILTSTIPFNISKSDVLNTLNCVLENTNLPPSQVSTDLSDDVKQLEVSIEQDQESSDFIQKDIKLNPWKEVKIEHDNVYYTAYYYRDLANGLRVVLFSLPSCSKDKNEVVYSLGSGKAKNSVEENELASSEFIARTTNYSGLANLNDLEFQRYLASKGITLDFYKGNCVTELSGTSKLNSIHEMFKIFNSYFCARNFKKEVFDYFIAFDSQIAEENKYNEEFEFDNWLNKVLFPSNPYYYERYAKDADFEVARNLCDRLLGNPENYTLLLIGDLTKKDVDWLIYKYLSPIKNKYVSTEVCTIPLCFESGDYTFYYSTEQASKGFVYIPLEVDDDFDKCFARRILSSILSQRLCQELRVEQGRSYAQSAYFVKPAFDSNYQFLYISFDAQDQYIAQMHQHTQQVISNLWAFGLTDEELEEAKLVYYGNDDIEKHLQKLIEALASSPMLAISKVKQESATP